MSADCCRIARVGLHNYEEPCISGTRGSGTIFFSGCSLKCAFCQNFRISHEKLGLEISKRQLADCILYLQDEGAHNINLVTPSQWLNLLVDVLDCVKPKLKVPVVWNSSGYESVDAIKKINGLVDIYLPDFKYSDDNMAWEYSRARGYFNIAREAIAEMKRQQPKDTFDDCGLMQRGVIVRHLVLPDAKENTRGVLKAIADIDRDCFVSLMCQYFPTEAVKNHQSLGRRLTQGEYDDAIDAFFEAGLKNGFSQDIESAIEDYVPDFDLQALSELVEKLGG